MSDGELERRVQDVLRDVRPNLQMDGNDARVTACRDGVVSICIEGIGTRSSITYRGLQDTVCEKIRENLPYIQNIVTFAGDGM